MAEPLSIIFGKSLAAGKLPRDWTKANVTPIHKKGRRTESLNYRPISLTSVPCKVLERLLKTRIVEHLEQHNIITQNQHGFRSRRSCVTQLLEYMFDLENDLDDGYYVDAVYLDCQKAFDSVPHPQLLVKLRSAGIDGEEQEEEAIKIYKDKNER